MQSTALLAIDRIFRRAELVGGARLHFHERELRAIPHDEIDLAATGQGPIIPRHHRAALRLQVAMRHVLANAPRIPGIPPLPEPVGGAIEQTHHFSTSNSNSMTLPRTT